METETYTVRLAVPRGTVPAGRTIKELRPLAIGMEGDETWIDCQGNVQSMSMAAKSRLTGEIRIVLNPAPTWTPPASLPDGEWLWKGKTFCNNSFSVVKGLGIDALLGRDWTDPPLEGRWRIESGKATYLGA